MEPTNAGRASLQGTLESDYGKAMPERHAEIHHESKGMDPAWKLKYQGKQTNIKTNRGEETNEQHPPAGNNKVHNKITPCKKPEGTYPANKKHI